MLPTVRFDIVSINPITARRELERQHKEIERLEQRIAELEAAQRWIPVEERLPEEGDIYQVVKQSEAGAYTTHCYYYGNGLWDVMSDQVSHWMNDFPLPDGSK